MPDSQTQTRRSFLKLSAATTLGFVGLHRAIGCACDPTLDGRNPGPYGDLIADTEGVLDLPSGFSYRIISRAGDQMDDGLLVPGKQDGMAAFPGTAGRTIVVCNHENDVGNTSQSAFGESGDLSGRIDPAAVYDSSEAAFCAGGTTTFVYDTRARRMERQFLSLAGSLRNCAGGPTPWNSWITCEETVRRSGESCELDHGYNFDVPATAEPRVRLPVPLKAMGRFKHEAVAVDERSGIVYQTEDRGDGLIYRFIPKAPGKLADGGALQALKIDDRPSLDTSNRFYTRIEVGERMSVSWLDLDDAESPRDDLRLQGSSRGAAQFARGEGMWFGGGAIYFVCTSGGVAGKGQIWKYVPSPFEGTYHESKSPGSLELFIEPNDGCLVENADNVVVTPWGDLILAEDGSPDQFLVGVTMEGVVYKFARNALDGSEFAGPTFSPDGSTMFVNLQHSGLTLAIMGPWSLRSSADA